MNVYDFDGTIYDGDCTVDFYLYCLKRHIKLLKYAPCQLVAGIKYGFGKLGKTEFKERFFRFLQGVPDIDLTVELFWQHKQKKIKAWYLHLQKPDDVVITASPEFLVKAGCKTIGVTQVLGSRVDKRSGIYDGLNCRGEEKVRRFREIWAQEEIDAFYSDSRADAPLAQLAKKSYMVRREKLSKWCD